MWASMQILFYVHDFMHVTQENITHVVKLNSRWTLIFIEMEPFPSFTSHVCPFYLFQFDESTCIFPKHTAKKKILSFVDFANISNIIIYIGKFLMKNLWLIKTRVPLNPKKLELMFLWFRFFFKNWNQPVIKENQITAPQLKLVLSWKPLT